MAPVAFLHHLDPPVRGHAARVLRAAGLEIQEVHVMAGDELPDLDAVGGIVAFGGHESARDRHPPLAAEARLLRDAVEREVPVLGICLGGQLLARALGAPVRRAPRRTVAWSEIQPLPAAAEDPLFGGLPERPVVLHWNEDFFELPEGAVELTTRVGPGVEAFRAGTRAWGIQFHPEVEQPDIDTWYAWGERALAEAGVDEERARADDARHLPGQARLADALFGAFARVAARVAGG